MAITIDWGTQVITVNKVDMVLIQTLPSVIYEMDLDVFRLALGELLDDTEGMPFPDTHIYLPPVSVGGANLARVVQLINGYTVTYEDDQYRVQIVNGNSNLGSNINVNQVSVSTANSAGLQDLGSLQAASFGGVIAIDVTSSFAGTVFPIGTKAQPVNNVVDAHFISMERGIHTFHLFGDLTLTATDFSHGHTFTADNTTLATVTIESGADVTKCTFINVTVDGVLDGSNALWDCRVLDITSLNGFMFRCALEGTVTLGGGIQCNMFSCYSGVAGGGLAATPTIDMGGTGQSLVIRDYSGGLKITNRTGTDAASIDMSSGQVIVDATVTAGDVYIRGIAKVTDNSTGTATVNQDDVLNTRIRSAEKYSKLNFLDNI